jgi:lipopolysaccharide export LptBFGC system permease protein LptF
VIKIVDRYIGLAAMQGTLLLWVGLTLLYMMISALGELRDSGAGYGLGDALWYVLWTTPRMAYQIFPFAALLGVLMGVGSLASANELVGWANGSPRKQNTRRVRFGSVSALVRPSSGVRVECGCVTATIL